MYLRNARLEYSNTMAPSGQRSGGNAASDRETLMLYVLGPGYGESVVVILPDMRVVVMDCCGDRTSRLLDQLGVQQIDLLILSHPDLDHIRGIPRLLERYPPAEVWRYPFATLLREFAARWSTGTRGDELRRALTALDSHVEKTGLVAQVGAGHEPWPSAQAGYEVRALAPTHYDQNRAQRTFQRLLRDKHGRRKLEGWIERLARGGRVHDTANVVSLAATISWGEHRILLAGDVLRGSASPHSGWKGVLRLLRRRDQLSLVTNVAAVKVAHHGSYGAWEQTAWALHAKSKRPHAIIAPFSPSALPDSQTLQDLAQHAYAVHLCSADAKLLERVSATGWNASTSLPETHLPEACVAMEFRADGTMAVMAGPNTHAGAFPHK